MVVDVHSRRHLLVGSCHRPVAGSVVVVLWLAALSGDKARAVETLALRNVGFAAIGVGMALSGVLHPLRGGPVVRGGRMLLTFRRKTAACALLPTAYLPVWAAAAILGLWAIWRMFWMAVVVGIMALVGVGALVEIAVRWVSRLF